MISVDVFDLLMRVKNDRRPCTVVVPVEDQIDVQLLIDGSGLQHLVTVRGSRRLARGQVRVLHGGDDGQG